MFLIEVYLDMMLTLFNDDTLLSFFGQSQHKIDYDVLAKWVVNKLLEQCVLLVVIIIPMIWNNPIYSDF